jgi:hypothetical protein
MTPFRKLRMTLALTRFQPARKRNVRPKTIGGG